jgi:hypothetical protein
MIDDVSHAFGSPPSSALYRQAVSETNWFQGYLPFTLIKHSVLELSTLSCRRRERSLVPKMHPAQRNKVDISVCPICSRETSRRD